MQRIKLSNNEKRLLHNIAAGVDYWPDGMGDEAVAASASELERLGLVRAMWSEGGRVVDVKLTDYGKTYILVNPNLRNPVDWKWVVSTAIGAATLAVMMLTFFVACQIAN